MFQDNTELRIICDSCDLCVVKNKVLNSDTGRYALIVINLVNNDKIDENCELFQCDKNFQVLLDLLNLNGSVQICVSRNIPKKITEICSRINNKYSLHTCFTNKDFTASFPEKKPQSLSFYYSVVNTKPLFFRIFLKLLIGLGMYDFLYYLCGNNKVITIGKIGLSTHDIVAAAKEKILKEWSMYFKLGKPEDIFYLIVKRGPRKLLFLFADNSFVPFACAKLTSTGDSYSAFLREFMELQYLQKEASN